MTKYRNDITYDAVSELLQYEPETGKLFWRVDRLCKNLVVARAGDEAGCLCKDQGYVRIGINGRLYGAHRLAWLLHHEEWPKHQIDHVNGDRADNRIENLRSMTNQQNSRAFNKTRAGVSSKYRGVSWDKQVGKWKVCIMVAGKKKHLGLFTDELDAALAYDTAAKQLGFASEALNVNNHPDLSDLVQIG